jgi:hypothetical protein
MIGRNQNMSSRHDKQINWDVIRSRLTTKGPDGSLLPAIKGTESEEELRALVFGFVQSCSHKHQDYKCPFCILSGLSPDSQKNVVSRLKREDMIVLFEMEQESRNSLLK